MLKKKKTNKQTNKQKTKNVKKDKTTTTTTKTIARETLSKRARVRRAGRRVHVKEKKKTKTDKRMLTEC